MFDRKITIFHGKITICHGKITIFHGKINVYKWQLFILILVYQGVDALRAEFTSELGKRVEIPVDIAKKLKKLKKKTIKKKKNCLQCANEGPCQ